MRETAEFEVIVYGASGFTGRLVAEYLVARTRAGAAISWAMAGRSLARLAAVRDAVGAPSALPLIEADGSDRASLERMAQRARVVATTVGPYQLYGSELVAACASTGTDYVDLCGEPAWMRTMIDAHAAAAKASGARIVFSCGFDSVPFDLGVFMLQQIARERTGSPARRVKGRVRKMQGTFSGGTAASLKATMVAAAKDPGVYAVLRDPFALTPGCKGPAQPSGMKPELDAAIGSWVAPFIMAPINTKNVHRSNHLLAYAYGADFVYDEMLVTSPGEKGQALAMAIAGDRSMLRDDGPKPGEGPSRAEREAGHYDLLFIGETAAGGTVRVAVAGNMDPGYGSTSKMISECALCLARDVGRLPGGIWTPASAFGQALIERLIAHAGLTFRVE